MEKVREGREYVIVRTQQKGEGTVAERILGKKDEKMDSKMRI